MPSIRDDRKQDLAEGMTERMIGGKPSLNNGIEYAHATNELNREHNWREEERN